MGLGSDTLPAVERRPPRDQDPDETDAEARAIDQADDPAADEPAREAADTEPSFEDDEPPYDDDLDDELPDEEPARRAPHIIRAALAIALILVLFAIPDLVTLPQRDELATYRGTIVELVEAPAQPGPGLAPNVRVRLSEGPLEGQVVDANLEGPGGTVDVSGYHEGDDVVVTFSRTPDGQEYVAVSDRWRLPQIGALAVLFAAVVVLIGGWRGVRALIALGLTIAVVLRILLPLLIEGVSPIPLAVAAATGVTIATIVLTEGWSRSSVAAILGTATALALTGMLGAAVTQIGGFTGAAASDLIFLQTQAGTALDLRGLLLAAFILGSIGVLDDVTVTQAAFIDEVGMRAGLRGRQLFASALDIGRSHIAATINTLFLAYVGATLPLLVILIVSQQPAALVLNGEVIAIEIVRTLVGSIGIVAAVPITSAIATLLVSAGDRRRAEQQAWSAAARRAEDGFEPNAPLPPRPPRRRLRLPRFGDPLPTLVGGLLLIGLTTALVAALIGPLGPTPAGAANASPSLVAGSPGPSAGVSSGPSGPAGSASPGPSRAAASATAVPPSGGPSPTSDVVPLAVEGEPVDVLDGSGRLGAVTLLEWQTEELASGPVLHARVGYDADRAWTVGPGNWSVLSAAGEEAIATPGTRSPSLNQRSLAPGQTIEGWITVPMPGPDADVFLVYRSASGTPVFAIDLR
jgi:uncharacterized membrane protein